MNEEVSTNDAMLAKALNDAQQANARLETLAEEHERLKQYVYTYVSYLPSRMNHTIERKGEE